MPYSDYDDVPYYGPEDSGVSSDYTRDPGDFCRESKYPQGDVRNIDFDDITYVPPWDDNFGFDDDEYYQIQDRQMDLFPEFAKQAI